MPENPWSTSIRATPSSEPSSTLRFAMAEDLRAQDSPEPHVEEVANPQDSAGKQMSEHWAQTEDAKTEDSQGPRTESATQATEANFERRAQAKEATGSKENAPFHEGTPPSDSKIPIKELTTAVTELIGVLNREKAKSDIQNNPLSSQEVRPVPGEKGKSPQKEASKGPEPTPAPLQQEIRIGPLLGDEDYTRKYPNDEYGAEMFPNARVWRTYLDERDIADKDYISDNNATLDGILVFASIFSAIVTTFVTQTYQSLVPDPQAASQGLLSELIAVQRVAANGSSVNAVPSYDTSSPMFKPGTADVWLNSLWFVSLMFSLLTAFLGVLSKQWLYQYVSVTSGTPRDRALVRQARSLGLHDWQVPALIGFLPIILHLSLALFLVGLIILLHSVLPSVAYFGIVLVGTVYAAYMVSNFLPIIYPRCPYRTALTPKIYQLYQFIPSFPRLHVGLSFQKDAEAFAWKLSQGFAWLRGLKLSIGLRYPTVTQAALWKDAERADALNTRGALEARALSWLYNSSFNPTAQQIVLQAFAGLDPGLDQYKGNWDDDLIPQVLEQLQHTCTHLSRTRTPTENTDRQFELYLRALIQIQPFCGSLFLLNSQYHLALLDEVRYHIIHIRDRKSFLLNLGQCRLQGFRFSYTGWTKRSLDIQLSAGIWTTLIQQKNIINSTETTFEWHMQCLRIIQRAGYFTNTVRNNSPSMTLRHPNTSMCEAMFHSILQSSNSKSPTRVEVLLRFALRAISSTGKRTNIAEIVELTLDCALDSVRDKISVADAWSCSDTELLVELISSQEWKELGGLQIWKWRALWLLEKFCMARHLDLIPTSVLCLWILPAMRTYLDDYPSGREIKLRHYGPQCVGLVLLCWAFDQRCEIAYDGLITGNFFRCVELWKVIAPSERNTAQSLSILLDHLLGGIPTEKERALGHPNLIPSYVERLVDHIHQSDHLALLCHFLLIGTSDEAREPVSLARLLSLKPTHHTWSAALVQLKLRMKNWGGLPALDEQPNRWQRPKNMTVLDDALAIQNILNIHAHNQVLDFESLDALAWDNGRKLPADNRILVAHQLASASGNANQAGLLLLWWRDRLHNILPSRKRHVVPDAEARRLS